ncbi:MAG: LEM-3-like GIY-YIG domain-containing protein [Myxococcota bacterium]
MKKKKFPLKDLWIFLEEQNELELLNELKNKKFDISTSRRGFAIIRLKEEGMFEKFLSYAKKQYPKAEFLIQVAINKYNSYESVPEAEYVNLHYEGKTRFTPAEIKNLKFYVYELIDPKTNKVFYVGKGRANRVYTHLKKAINGDPSDKGFKIREILKTGQKPKLNIVKQGLTEEEAYSFERKLIDEYGLENLTNVQPGKIGNFGGSKVK